MRYKEEILNRIEMSLRTVNHDVANDFRQNFTKHYAERFVFCSEINLYFLNLLAAYGGTYNIGVPENDDAIGYWLEDIDMAVLPVLRLGKLHHETRSKKKKNG